VGASNHALITKMETPEVSPIARLAMHRDSVNMRTLYMHD
jgi:hypothetical protein